MEHTAPIDVEREIEMKQKKAEYMKQYRLKRKREMEQRASYVQLQVESSEKI
jgi:phage anti-repressor protein